MVPSKQATLLLLAALLFWAGRLGAQEADSIAQLNRLRVLQNQIIQEAVGLPEANVVDHWKFLLVNSSMTYTSNANLTPGGSSPDVFTTNALGLGWQPALGRGFGFATSLLLTDFRYVRMPSLSLSFLDWDVGLNWSGTVAGMDAQFSISQTLETTQQDVHQMPTLSSILTVEGILSREIMAGHTLSASIDLSATPYSTPWENNYASASVSCGYAWNLTKSCSLSLSALAYETSYFAGPRNLTSSAGATVTWAVTSWLSVSAFADQTWNFGSNGGSNYTVLDTGMNLSAFLSF
ncbi:MAG: hypothetical protein WEB60_02905 [Terrimicrobiaceae bacterium]